MRAYTRRALIVSAGGILTVLLLALTTAAEIALYSSRSDAQPADAAIVLGAAVFKDVPSPVFEERIRHAVDLYQSGQVRFLVMTGGLGSADHVTEADLAPLDELVAVDEFERVGIWRERQTWREYVRYLAEWAGATGFSSELRRVTETGRLVFLELAERLERDGGVIEKNSMMAYEFDANDRIRSLYVYHQMAK